MNRIFPRPLHAQTTPAKFTNPVLRPTQRLRADTEVALRDMAYVLHLTQRIKVELLDERSLSAPLR